MIGSVAVRFLMFFLTIGAANAEVPPSRRSRTRLERIAADATAPVVLRNWRREVLRDIYPPSSRDGKQYNQTGRKRQLLADEAEACEGRPARLSTRGGDDDDTQRGAAAQGRLDSGDCHGHVADGAPVL